MFVNNVENREIWAFIEKKLDVPLFWPPYQPPLNNKKPNGISRSALILIIYLSFALLFSCFTIVASIA